MANAYTKVDFSFSLVKSSLILHCLVILNKWLTKSKQFRFLHLNLNLSEMIHDKLINKLIVESPSIIVTKNGMWSRRKLIFLGSSWTTMDFVFNILFRTWSKVVATKQIGSHVEWLWSWSPLIPKGELLALQIRPPWAHVLVGHYRDKEVTNVGAHM